MREKEQLHGSPELPHQPMWQPLDSDIFPVETQYHTILSLFERQVELHPEKTVVLFRDQVLTYRQLDRCATALGQRLCAMGIGREDRVAILAERSLEMVVAVYGVLKAGAAYVPIDGAYPPDRISYILEDAAPKAVLLFRMDYPTDIPKVDLTHVLTAEPGELSLPRGEAQDLAYLIYTSGTTGKPKGVMIEHRNVVNYSRQDGQGVLRYLPRGTAGTIVSLTNFVFDIFVTELLMAPMLGMTVILADDRQQVDAEALLELMERHPAAIMQTTPSRVQLYLSQKHGEDALRTFSYMMLGGEAVSAQLVQRLHRIHPTAKIVDVYGPSETTVWSTCADVTRGDVTIGTPITNTLVYILDGMELCGVGKAGELCIGGDGVARGYLNREDLTAEKFIPNPYGPGRIYRTGDLAQWREDGNLEFLGRMDDQVKIRGTRIELGEIDAVLRQLPEVRDCAVIAREDGSGQKELFAFVVSDEVVNLHQVRQAMGAFLPESMIPAYLAQIDKIPLNPNGKLDKRALPQQVHRLSGAYAEPVTATEKKLCLLFSEILGVEPIGVHDHFFQLGGHSFRTIRLRNRIEEEFGCELSQSEIFADPTPAALGLLLDHRSRLRQVPMVSHPELMFLPVSSSQRGLFYDSHLREDDYTYHLVGVYLLTPELSVERFREAMRAMVRRHEILRTVFLQENGEPYQKILPYMEPDLTVAEDEGTDTESLVRRWLKPFDIEQGPLIRGRLVRGKDRWLFLLDMHHMISDAMGRELILAELSDLYEGKCLAEPAFQYKDHCIWLSQQDLSSQRAYWLSQYETLPPALELPTDYHRTVTPRREGGMLSLPLTGELSDRIRKLAKGCGVSEYMIFLSAAFILLSRHSGGEDIVIGSAFSGRTNRGAQSMPGMFVNTLPLRGNPVADKPYRTFLEEVRELSFRGQENQDYAYGDLLQELSIHRDPGRNPLFDVMLVMQNGDKGEYGSDKLQLRPMRECYYGASFDLTFNIEEDGAQYCLSLQYSKDLFADSTAKLYLQHFHTLLTDIVRNPQRNIGALTMISDQEKALLDVYRGQTGDYDAEKTIPQLFEAQVRRDPHAPAIVYGEERITYGELNQRANSLAYRLRQEGVGPNTTVALLLPQSIERFVGIYGVLKAGGAYIPIDPDYPQERIRYILSDSKAKLLLTSGVTGDWDTPTLDIGQESLHQGDCVDLPHLAGPGDLAYCIYTSGTTGKPKGVMVEHRGVSNLKAYFEQVIGITSRDRILQFANYVFDGSVWEMNMALLTGACLILVADRMNVEQICHTIEQEGVTVASLPPNLYAQLRDISPRILVTAGSAADRSIVEKAAHCRYINSYGPTECTVAVTHWEGQMEYSFVPIGKPIPNKEVYILRGEQLCALGEPGEICVGGVGIARGYLGQDELTARCFVPNPFGEGVLYRTGDMGLWMADGNIRFLGRTDDQVKVRGYRVEPGEIEAVLRALPYIRDCTVAVRQEPMGEYALHAYVVPREPLSFDRVRLDLRRELPDYMIPAYFMELEQIPVTPNGKVDKGQLPQIAVRSDSEYIPPRNPRERLLVQAMEEILQLRGISVKDGFFEMGGDSIKAIRIVSYLRERNMALTVRNVMQSSTVEEIALYMEDLLENPYDQGESCGTVTDTPMLRMFRHWNLAKPEHFNQAVFLPMDATEEALRYALNRLVEHHDILRGVYRENKLIILPYSKDSHFTICSYDLSREAEADTRIEELCTRLHRTMDLSQGPLVKACLFRIRGESVVMIAIHHLLVDSVSWHILTEDLNTAVEAYSRGQEAKLPLKTASFRQWADALQEYGTASAFEKEREYWNTLAAQIPYSRLQMPRHTFAAVKETQLSLTATQTEQLLTEACGTYHTQINDLLLAALSLAIADYTGQNRVALCLEGHGREPIHVPMDVDRTVGWFTCAYPVLLPCTENVGDAIIETKELLHRVPNRGLGFGLQYSPSVLDEVSLYFNYIGRSNESDRVGATSWEGNAVGGAINFNGGIFDDCLTFRITAGRGWEPTMDLAELGELYHRALCRILEHCLSSQESYMTYADVDAEDLEDEDFDEISALLGLT